MLRLRVLVALRRLAKWNFWDSLNVIYSVDDSSVKHSKQEFIKYLDILSKAKSDKEIQSNIMDQYRQWDKKEKSNELYNNGCLTHKHIEDLIVNVQHDNDIDDDSKRSILEKLDCILKKITGFVPNNNIPYHSIHTVSKLENITMIQPMWAKPEKPATYRKNYLVFPLDDIPIYSKKPIHPFFFLNNLSIDKVHNKENTNFKKHKFIIENITDVQTKNKWKKLEDVDIEGIDDDKDVRGNPKRPHYREVNSAKQEMDDLALWIIVRSEEPFTYTNHRGIEEEDSYVRFNALYLCSHEQFMTLTKASRKEKFDKPYIVNLFSKHFIKTYNHQEELTVKVGLFPSKEGQLQLEVETF